MDNQEQKRREEFEKWAYPVFDDIGYAKNRYSSDGVEYAWWAFVTAKQSCAAELAEKDKKIAELGDVINSLALLKEDEHAWVVRNTTASQKEIDERTKKCVVACVNLSDDQLDFAFEVREAGLFKIKQKIEELTRKNAELEQNAQLEVDRLDAQKMALEQKNAELEADNARKREALESCSWNMSWHPIYGDVKHMKYSIELVEKVLSTPTSDWLEQHDREVAAKALENAASNYLENDDDKLMRDYVAEWLQLHASGIRAQQKGGE